VVVGNVLRGNELANLVVMDQAAAACEHNVVCDSAGVGVLFLGRAAGALRHNLVHRNEQIGVRCSGSSAPLVAHNRVLGGGRSHGVVLDRRTEASLSSNVIHGCGLPAVVVRDDAAPALADNVLVSDAAAEAAGAPPPAGGALAMEGRAGGSCVGNVLQVSGGGCIRVGAEVRSRISGNAVCVRDLEHPLAVVEAAAARLLAPRPAEYLLVVNPDPACPPCLAVRLIGTAHGAVLAPFEAAAPSASSPRRQAAHPAQAAAPTSGERWEQADGPHAHPCDQHPAAARREAGPVVGPPPARMLPHRQAGRPPHVSAGDASGAGGGEALEGGVAQLLVQLEETMEMVARLTPGAGPAGREAAEGEQMLAALLLTRWHLARGPGRGAPVSVQAARARASEKLQVQHTAHSSSSLLLKFSGARRAAFPSLPQPLCHLPPSLTTRGCKVRPGREAEAAAAGAACTDVAAGPPAPYRRVICATRRRRRRAARAGRAGAVGRGSSPGGGGAVANRARRVMRWKQYLRDRIKEI
jgi:hypothetical protein